MPHNRANWEEYIKPGGQEVIVRPQRSGLEVLFGPLESRVMTALWSEGSAASGSGPGVGVRRVMGIVNSDNYHKRVAYTTIATTMNRLVEKGVLQRTLLHDQSFAYRTINSEQETWRHVVVTTVTMLFNDFPELLGDALRGCGLALTTTEVADDR